MRPARRVRDAIVWPNGTLRDVRAYTKRVADIASAVPCIVITTSGGTVPDERFSRVAQIVIDAYATVEQDAEDLAEETRRALLAAAGHRIGAVTTTSPPVLVEAGEPFARCTAVYAVQLTTTA